MDLIIKIKNILIILAHLHQQSYLIIHIKLQQCNIINIVILLLLSLNIVNLDESPIEIHLQYLPFFLSFKVALDLVQILNKH